MSGADVAGSPGAARSGGAARARPLVRYGVPFLVIALAAFLRLWGLGHPERMFFDETYYVQDARDLLAYGVERGRAVHPPVGKWLIGAGIALVGNDPFGWRVAAALAGTLTVALTYLVGRRLLASPWLAGLAALLVAVDGLALTMSRIAMLDAFLALFVLTACWSALVELDQRAGGRLVLPGARWWTGILLGLAVATKWSGLLAVGAVGLVLLVGEVATRRRSSAQRRSLPGLVVRTALTLAVPVLVVPSLVYLASYAGWFASWPESYTGQRACADPPCAASSVDRVESWVGYQLDIVGFHADLEVTHPYRSDPLGWPVLERPVLYYLERCTPQMRLFGEVCTVAPDRQERIVGVGNPALWWPALPAYALLGWRLLRPPRPGTGAGRRGVPAVLLAFLLLQWAPWLVTGPGYLFYLTPAVPFMALALAYVAGDLGRHRGLRWLPGVLAVAALAVLGWLLPLWWGLELSEGTVGSRLWLGTWR